MTLPESSYQFEQLMLTADRGSVLRVLREFEYVLSGGTDIDSLTILGETPARFTTEEQEDFAMLLDNIDTWSRGVSPALYAAIQLEPFRELFWQFLDTVSIGDEPEETTQRLWVFLDDSRRDTLPEEQYAFDEMMRSIEGMDRQFTLLFKLYLTAWRAKEMVVECLGQTTKVATFITEGMGYQITGASDGFQVRLDNGKLVTLIAK